MWSVPSEGERILTGGSPLREEKKGTVMLSVPRKRVDDAVDQKE